MPRLPRLHQLVLRVPRDSAEAVGAWLVQAGAGGVEEAAAGPRLAVLRVYGESRPALDSLAVRVRAALRDAGVEGRAEVELATASANDWDAPWTAGQGVVRVSRTLFLAPTSAEPPPPPGGRVVRLEPAFAFGFGEHATTRLAARAVERYCRARPGSLLDVGTGTGVLAIVAAVTGARRAVGLDLDRRAVASARRNAALNGVTRRCRFSRTPVASVRGRFDFVVANLDYRVLLEISAPLSRLVAPGGGLTVTGFLAEHSSDIEAHYAGLGFRRHGKRREDGGWALIAFRWADSSSPPMRALRARVRETRRRPRNR